MFRKIVVLGLFATSVLVLAAPDAYAVWINGKWYAKGVEEEGKVWYDTVFAGTNPPVVATRVFGVKPWGNPQWQLSITVDGFLTCVQKVCLRNPDKPECAVPGNAHGTPYQTLAGSISLTLQATSCAVKGSKGTCKVLAFDHILNADLEGAKACPGGFVPDFIPDPFIGRTSTCDVSLGALEHDTTDPDYPKPVCRLPGATTTTPATSLCQFVRDHAGTIGEPYAIQFEIPNDNSIISTSEYAKLGCTPNVLK